MTPLRLRMIEDMQIRNLAVSIRRKPPCRVNLVG
jgi:hypothetical protein